MSITLSLIVGYSVEVVREGGMPVIGRFPSEKPPDATFGRISESDVERHGAVDCSAVVASVSTISHFYHSHYVLFCLLTRSLLF